MRNRFEAFSGCILELNRCLQKLKDQEMRKYGLRAGHAMCLYYLGKHPEGLTATQLTELCKEDKAAISRCLTTLLDRQLICADFPRNKRSYRTLHRLTPEGADLAEKVNARVAEVLDFGGLGMDDSQRAVFYDSLELILNNLSRYLNETT